MQIRMRYALPALMMLAGCASTNTTADRAANIAAPTAAAPQRVVAVSDAIGAKMDSMLASISTTTMR